MFVPTRYYKLLELLFYQNYGRLKSCKKIKMDDTLAPGGVDKKCHTWQKQYDTNAFAKFWDNPRILWL